jgi:hypothetical protein
MIVPGVLALVLATTGVAGATVDEVTESIRRRLEAAGQPALLRIDDDVVLA